MRTCCFADVRVLSSTLSLCFGKSGPWQAASGALRRSAAAAGVSCGAGTLMLEAARTSSSSSSASSRGVSGASCGPRRHLGGSLASAASMTARWDSEPVTAVWIMVDWRHQYVWHHLLKWKQCKDVCFQQDAAEHWVTILRPCRRHTSHLIVVSSAWVCLTFSQVSFVDISSTTHLYSCVG